MELFIIPFTVEKLLKQLKEMMSVLSGAVKRIHAQLVIRMFFQYTYTLWKYIYICIYRNIYLHTYI